MNLTEEFFNGIRNLQVSSNELAQARLEVLTSMEPSMSSAIKLECNRDPIFSSSIDRLLLLACSLLSAAKLYESDAAFNQIVDSLKMQTEMDFEWNGPHFCKILQQVIQNDLIEVESGQGDYQFTGSLSDEVVINRLNLLQEKIQKLTNC